MRFVRFLAALFVVVPAVAFAREVPPSFADLVEKLSPAVVNIQTTQKVQSPNIKFKFKGLPEGEGMDPFREFFERFGEQFGGGEKGERDVTSLGSGFVIDPTGYIVTNNHVVAKADEVTVKFQDDSKYDAKILGRDPKTDLALLKIDAKKELPFVTFGNSDEMRVGDWVIAIGNPFGLGGSVSAGIVSARSRNINSGPFDDYIQTDAAINRGNSGGPLFNAQGEVIGVNSAIYSPTGGNVGIGFSIPSALAQPVLKQLREFGRTHRGWLGVKIQHVTDELADSLGLKKAQGALVLEVNEGSPAREAGVKSGDVILSFGDHDVEKMRTLPRMVAELKAGTTVKMKVWREGRLKTLGVTLGEMEEDEEEVAVRDEMEDEGKDPKSTRFMGMKLVALNAQLRSSFGVKKGVKGVLVLGIDPDTEAAGSELARGDVVVRANQEDVESVHDFKDAIKQAKRQGKNHALLRVNRRGNMMFKTIKTGK